jgi:hypothetical protein
VSPELPRRLGHFMGLAFKKRHVMLKYKNAINGKKGKSNYLKTTAVRIISIIIGQTENKTKYKSYTHIISSVR